MINKFNIPDDVVGILKKLNSHGYEAYIVGGCVRDMLLLKSPKDWDITTNAHPQQTKELFPKTIDTGLKHGTVTVVLNDENYEITTYRIDGAYSDSRRPEQVSFTSSLKEDLSRRDFTINALAYHPSTGIIDLFGGIQDLKSHVIRTVGDANSRFTEDALRMLRAVRFSAQLGFTIDTDTKNAIIKNRYLIQKISSERIRDELTKTITSDNPKSFTILRETSLIELILPEFEACFCTDQNNPYHIFNVAMHTLNSLEYIENNRILRWTMLLHDIGKPEVKTTDSNGIDHFYGHQKASMRIANDILTRLKFDNKSISSILTLIDFHDTEIGSSSQSVRRIIKDLGYEHLELLLKVKEADAKAQNPDLLEERIENLNKAYNLFKEIESSKQCVSMKELAISGNDLLELGFKQGREMGIVLQKLLDMVLDNPELNTKVNLNKIVLDKFNCDG